MRKLRESSAEHRRVASNELYHLKPDPSNPRFRGLAFGTMELAPEVFKDVDARDLDLVRQVCRKLVDVRTDGAVATNYTVQRALRDPAKPNHCDYLVSADYLVDSITVRAGSVARQASCFT